MHELAQGPAQPIAIEPGDALEQPLGRLVASSTRSMRAASRPCTLAGTVMLSIGFASRKRPHTPAYSGRKSRSTSVRVPAAEHGRTLLRQGLPEHETADVVRVSLDLETRAPRPGRCEPAHTRSAPGCVSVPAWAVCPEESMTTRTPGEIIHDLFLVAEGRRKFYPLYHELCDAAPAGRCVFGTWMLSSFADVRASLRDPRFGKDYVRQTEARFGPKWRGHPSLARGEHSMLDVDGPEHTRLRKLVVKGITRRRVLQDGDLLALAFERGLRL